MFLFFFFLTFFQQNFLLDDQCFFYGHRTLLQMKNCKNKKNALRSYKNIAHTNTDRQTLGRNHTMLCFIHTLLLHRNLNCHHGLVVMMIMIMLVAVAVAAVLFAHFMHVRVLCIVTCSNFDKITTYLLSCLICVNACYNVKRMKCID